MEQTPTPPQSSTSDHDLLVRLDEKINNILQSQQQSQQSNEKWEQRLRAVEQAQESSGGETKGKATTRDILFAVIGIVVAVSNPLVILWIANKG